MATAPLILRPDGSTVPLAYTPPRDEESFEEMQESLRALQEAVGGYIETVPIPQDNDLILLVNEDGLRLGLPPNAQASTLARQPIVGAAVLIPRALLC
jgi:hypothetical protein